MKFHPAFIYYVQSRFSLYLHYFSCHNFLQIWGTHFHSLSTSENTILFYAARDNSVLEQVKFALLIYDLVWIRTEAFKSSIWATLCFRKVLQAC